MSRDAFAAFVFLTVGWIAATFALYEPLYPLLLARALIWWGLLVMTIAAAVYVILDAPRGDAGWIRRDLAANGVLLLLLLAALLDALSGFRVLDLRAAGWIAFAAAAVHPLVTDFPHRRRPSGPDASPAPAYVPPACVAIDWTLSALLLAALWMLRSY